MYESITPYEPSKRTTFDETPEDVVNDLLEQACERYDTFKFTSFDQRAELLRRVADLLEERVDECAAVMTEEMGKTLVSAKAEAKKCAWVCRYYAENAVDFLKPEKVETDWTHSWVEFNPLGVILAIMPWNFPFWQFFRFAAPALMAGNTVLLKHASNVPRCANLIQKLFDDASFPSGCVTNLFISGKAAQALIEDERIAAVTLTGSVPAGRHVAATAGKFLKPHVLELGGSDPFIVLADADLDQAVEGAVLGRFQNNGQSCIAAKRFIVEAPVYEAFIEKLTEKLQSLKLGNPMEPDTDLGPMAREDLRDELHKIVEDTIQAGGRLVCGGQIPDQEGWYYPPTLIADVTLDMPAFNDETFGPVAAVTKVDDVELAIEAANCSSFGLGASLWTSADLQTCHDYISRIEAGCVAVNSIVKSDPRLPFGGIKDSGYGRELSIFGIREFVNIKSVMFQS